MRTDSLTPEEFLSLVCLCMSRTALLEKGATQEQISGDEMLFVVEATLTNFYDLINKEPENLDNDTLKTIKKMVARTKSLLKNGE